MTQSIEISGDIIRVNGQYLPPVPGYKRHKGLEINQAGGRVFVNGWEWTGDEWKRTFRSIFYSLL